MQAVKHQERTYKKYIVFVVYVCTVENPEVNLILKRNKRKIFRMNNLLNNIFHIVVHSSLPVQMIYMLNWTVEFISKHEMKELL